MKSLYRRSWFPGIGRKPLESIRIGCEPSPAQSRLFFCKLFHLCARTRPRVCSLKLGTNKPPKVKTNSHQKKQKRFQIFLWSPSPCPGIGVPRPSIGVPRPSMDVPRVVLGLSSAPCAFNMPSFFLAEILWMFLISWLKLPSACPFPRKIYIVFFSAGHLWTIQRGLSISYYYSLGQYPGISWYNP